MISHASFACSRFDIFTIWLGHGCPTFDISPTGDLENRKHLDAGKFRVISAPVLKVCKQQLIPRQCTNH